MNTPISGKPIHISDDAFDAVVGQSGTVLVDFWAPWCGPCQAIAPVLDALAAEYQDRATIAKIDVDQHQQKAAQFGVRSIPTLVLFKDGQPVQTLVGLQDRAALASAIESALPLPV